MPHAHGYRNNTRTLFKKAFKTAGRCHTTTYLQQFKRGDFVDIKVDSSIHKGMPHKHYHGRTGKVFNVNKRAVGVIINKEVNGRIIPKRLHIAVPHVRPSKCQTGWIAQVKANEAQKKAVRAGAKKVDLKRKPLGPKAGYLYTIAVAPETIQPIPYSDLV